MSGKLIAIEGVDGVGKTYLAQNLAKELSASLVSMPPSQTQPLRKILFDPDTPAIIQAACLLAMGAVSDQEITSLLKLKHVVSDRCYFSAIVLNSLLNKDLVAAKLLDRYVSYFKAPDLTIYIKGEYDYIKRILNERESISDTDRMVLESPDFFLEADKLFITLIKQQSNYLIVKAPVDVNLVMNEINAKLFS